MVEYEEWRPVVGYEGLYEVSSLGRVRSLDRFLLNARKNGLRICKGKIIAVQKNKFGYLRVALCHNGKIKLEFVHRLVAFAFPEICGEWFEGAVVNHKDENKLSNVPENLEWLSTKDNINYGTHNQRQAKTRMENPYNNKPVKMISVEGELVKEFISVNQALRFLNNGGSVAHISRCASGKKWHKTAYGYRWEWA